MGVVMSMVAVHGAEVAWMRAVSELPPSAGSAARAKYISMITSPSLMAPLTGELACTSQGFAPLLAFTRNAWPPGIPSTAKYLAFGLSGWKYQLPLASLLMVLVQMSSSATTTVPKANPASRNNQNFMRQPPVARN